MDFGNDTLVLIGAAASVVVQALRLLAARFGYTPGDEIVAGVLLSIAAGFGIILEGIPVGYIFPPELFQGFLAIFGTSVAVYMLLLKKVLRPVETDE